MHPSILSQLQARGVDTSQKGKLVCPECGERKLSAAAKKPVAQCFGCGLKLTTWTDRDHYFSPGSTLIQVIANQCKDAMEQRSAEADSAYNYLTQVRHLPTSFRWLWAHDVLCLDIARVDLKAISRAVDKSFHEAEDAAIGAASGKERAAVKKRFIQLRKDLDEFIAEKLTVLSDVRWDGAVMFVYRDENGDPISLKLRQHKLEVLEAVDGLIKKPRDPKAHNSDQDTEDEDGKPIWREWKPRERDFITLQPYPGRRGLFDASLIAGDDWPKEPEVCPIAVEGEFNRLALVAAAAKWSSESGEDYHIPGFAVGGMYGVDVTAIHGLMGDDPFDFWYDNEPPKPGMSCLDAPGGFSLIERLADYASVYHFRSAEKDADEWVQSGKATPEALLALIANGGILLRPLEAVRRNVEQIRVREKNAQFRTQAIVKLLIDDLSVRGAFFDCGCMVHVALPEDGSASRITRFLTGDRHFDALLAGYGINASERDLIRDIQSGVYTRAIEDPDFAPVNEMHPISCLRNGHRCVNTFDGSYARIAPDGKMTSVRNGFDGVIFRQPKDASPWTYKVDLEHRTTDTLRIDTSDYLTRYVLDLINFDPGKLAPADVKLLVKTWVLSLYFPEMIRTTVFMLMVGSRGSAKTSYVERIGRVLLGPKFAANQMPDTADKLVETAASKPLVILDEWHTSSKGNRDVDAKLKKLATSKSESRRQLYTTRDMDEFQADAALILTCETLPTGDEALLQRMLIFHAAPMQVCATDEVYASVPELDAKLAEIRPYVLNELIHTIAALHVRLQQRDRSMKTSFRMADFAIFLLASAHAEGWGDEAKRLLSAMQSVQINQAADSDRIIGLFRELFAATPAFSGNTCTAKKWGERLSELVPKHDHETLSMLTGRRLGNRILGSPIIQSTLRIGLGEDSHTKLTLYTIHAEGSTATGAVGKMPTTPNTFAPTLNSTELRAQ